MERDAIIGFVGGMKPRDHVIFLYTSPEDKHFVLFTYLKTGLERGEVAAYVASQETTDQIKKAMQEYGVDVRRYERTGALRVIDYKEWYIISGGFDPSRTLDSWKNLLDESIKRGFRGLRVAGEMSCFFDNEIVEDLMDYEHALHRELVIPMMAICAYSKALFERQSGSHNPVDVLLGLLAAHSTAIIIAPMEGVVRTI